MKYYLWLEFNLSNDGFQLSTHWIDMVLPARTIYLALAIVASVKVYKQWRKYGE